jgi:hypothetical protein
MSNIVRIDDYRGRPRYYDFGTKNKSFLLTAKELKELGIKNWYFMLEVRRPDLKVQDIDPYNPNISAEDIGKILGECKQNPWFFFREVLRVPVRGAGTLPLYLHRAGCAAIWCWLNSIDFELVQPRQTYKTTVITGIMAYALLFEYRNCDIPYMHTKESRCTDNVGILRDYIMALPKYMNPWAKDKKPPGLQSLKYEAHKVNIAVLSAAKSEVDAPDKTRGYSLFTWFADECEFIPFMKAVLDGANPTIVQARITAREMGIRACMMYASTPGDLETNEGKEWQAILDNMPVFKEEFYDYTPEQIAHMKSVPKPDDPDQDRVAVTMLYIEFNHVQLRKDGQYLREQYTEALKKGTLGEYRRGVLLQRFRGGEGAFFRQEDLDFIQNNIREPNYDIFLMNKYHLYVYKHNIRVPDLNSSTPYFDMTIPYFIGIDCATGKDGDNTAICILNPYTLEVVGELLSPLMGGLDLMRVVTMLAKMLPKALFCIESNMTGVDIIDFVQESQLENRFYHDPRATEITKNVTNPNTPTEIKMKQRAHAKRYYGTTVGDKVRRMMFNILRETTHEYRHLINTKFLVKDICNLVQQKNGKMAAASGEHDDMVMAYLHTLYILKYGFDLGRFGVDKNLCSYSKAPEIMNDYVQSVIEDRVDNTAGLLTDSYEAQLLSDITSQLRDEYSNPGGYDDYGYKHNQYQQYGQLQQAPVAHATAANLSFFREVNNVANGFDTYGNNGIGGGGFFGLY